MYGVSPLEDRCCFEPVKLSLSTGQLLLGFLPTVAFPIEHMSSEDYDASKAPAFAVYSHILNKGHQAGAVLGVGVAPIAAAYTSLKLKQQVDAYDMSRMVGKTSVGVFGFISLLGALRLSQLDTEGLEDRTYRLHYNKGQNRTDMFAQIGAVAGLAVGAAALRGAANASLMQYIGCSSVGAAAGILLHTITRPAEE